MTRTADEWREFLADLNRASGFLADGAKKAARIALAVELWREKLNAGELPAWQEEMPGRRMLDAIARGEGPTP